MYPHLYEHEEAHLVGDTAAHPMAQPWGALAALLVVAGVQPAASSRLAIAPMAAPSGAFNCVF